MRKLVFFMWLLLGASAWAQGRIRPVWQASHDAAGERIRLLLQADAFHQRLPQALNQLLRWPRDLPIVYCQNGAVNAWYSPSNHQITVSYDLAVYLHQLISTVPRAELIDPNVTVDELTRDCLDFFVMHEIGHALVHELDLPLVGNEEDAADEFATLICAQAMGTRGKQMATNAAQCFALLGRNETQLAKLAFWDEHSLSRQRYYRILANLHAAGPNPAIERVVPVTRLMESKKTYSAREQHWNRLLAAHETVPGSLPLQTVTLDPKNPRKLSWLLPAGQSLPERYRKIDSYLRASFVLPKNLTVVQKSTGIPRNLFLPISGQIVLSTEFFDSARPKVSPADLQSLQEFSLLQEFALALISDCDLPFTGDLEDAAAELTAVLVASDPQLQRLAPAVLRWYKVLAQEHKNVLDLKYWSATALDEQRYFQMLGYLYTQDPKLAPSAAAEIPGKRLAKLSFEYPQKKRNWSRLLAPFRPGK